MNYSLFDQIVMQDVLTERERQYDKWGYPDVSPFEMLTVLAEEVGEVAAAVNDAKYNGGSLADLRTELIQVAAVAIGWVEKMETT